LGAELSLDDRIVQVSEAARRMIEASPDRSPQRQYEFYRRAMSGIYTRLAATAQALDGVEAPRHALGAAPAYSDVDALLRELDILVDSLAVNGSSPLAKGRLRHLRRAVAVFGFTSRRSICARIRTSMSASSASSSAPSERARNIGPLASKRASNACWRNSRRPVRSHPLTSTSDKAPDLRVIVSGVEIGAAWRRTSKDNRSYHSVKLDDPSFTAPIYAKLFEGDDGECALIWSR
jgi:uncharacterized protein (DUF736 family)